MYKMSKNWEMCPSQFSKAQGDVHNQKEFWLQWKKKK